MSNEGSALKVGNTIEKRNLQKLQAIYDATGSERDRKALEAYKAKISTPLKDRAWTDGLKNLLRGKK